jgi:tetratricopeptide (TPR) repeat protein
MRPRIAIIVPTLLTFLAPAAAARAITSTEARTVAFKLQSEGMRLYKEGKYKEAIAALRQVVDIHLNSFMAYYYYGLALHADRRYGEAIEPLKIALELQPDYVQAHLALGDAYLKQGDADEARAEYLRALELQPNYAAAFDGLGRVFEGIGRDDEAETHYRKALEINVAFADAYTHLGDLYLRRGRQEDAIGLFLKAIAVKPDFSAAFTRLGIAYAGRSLFDDAIAAIRKAQSLAPRDPETYVALARIYLDLGSELRAEAEIQAALAQDPDLPGAHLILAELKAAREEFDAAVEVLQGLLDRGIEDALMRRAVAASLTRLREDLPRHRALREAAGGDPSDPAPHLDLARFLTARRTHHRAAAAYERAADLLRERSAPAAVEMRARFQAGTALLAARRHARAIAIFETLAGGEAPAALRAAALFNLGVARAALGLDEAALQAFDAYLRDHPDDPRARLYAGNAYLRLGRRDEARAAYTAYLDHGGGPEAEQVRRLLQTMGPGAADAPEQPAGAAARGGAA